MRDYVGSIISASALGVAAFSDQAFKAMAIPMVMAAVGIICSIIGSFFFVKTEENADQRTLLKALSRGTNLAAILIAIISFFLVWALLGIEALGTVCGHSLGLVAGVLIGKATEYTSDTYKPTQELSSKSQTGSATIIIGGLGRVCSPRRCPS